MRMQSFTGILLGSLMLVNLGHSIVPHHHHPDNVYSTPVCIHEESSGMDEPLHTGQQQDPLRHCHAFNGLFFIPGEEKNSGVKACREHLTVTAILPVPSFGENLFQNTMPSNGSISRLIGNSFALPCGLRAPPIRV